MMVDATERARRALALLFAVAAAFVSTGCATTPTIEPVPVSNFFSIQYFSGGAAEWTWARNDIYVRLPDNRLEYIGSAPAAWGSTEKGIQSSRRRGTIAISEDGRSLVFQHWALRAPQMAKLENGIYRYTYGEGLKQIYKENEVTVPLTIRWKEFPPDVMNLRLRRDYSLVGESWALRATGETLPMALLEAAPLHRAAFEGRKDECVRLVKDGAALDAETHWGFTPLDLALIRGHEDTALELLSLGADPGRGTYPALHRAVMLGRINVVKAMLGKGVDVNAADKHGYTPLHLAVFAGSRGVGGLNDFFDSDEARSSIAARNVTIPLVQLLLERGADPRIRDNYGRTPLDAIGVRTPPEVKELLEERAGSKT